MFLKMYLFIYCLVKWYYGQKKDVFVHIVFFPLPQMELMFDYRTKQVRDVYDAQFRIKLWTFLNSADR